MTITYLSNFFFENKGYHELTSPEKKQRVIDVAEKLAPLHDEILEHPEGKIIVKETGKVELKNFTKQVRNKIDEQIQLLYSDYFFE